MARASARECRRRIRPRGPLGLRSSMLLGRAPASAPPRALSSTTLSARLTRGDRTVLLNPPLAARRDPPCQSRVAPASAADGPELKEQIGAARDRLRGVEPEHVL